MLAFGRRMVDNFGWRFLFLLASVYFGVKGLVYRISYAAFLPYLRHKLGVDDATRYQSLFTVCLLPWSLKPFLGMISDVLPIGGYHKRWYIQASVVVGVVACALLAAAPVGKVAGGAMAAVLFFFITAETAACTLDEARAGGRGMSRAFACLRRGVGAVEAPLHWSALGLTRGLAFSSRCDTVLLSLHSGPARRRPVLGKDGGRARVGL